MFVLFTDLIYLIPYFYKYKVYKCLFILLLSLTVWSVFIPEDLSSENFPVENDSLIPNSNDVFDSGKPQPCGPADVTLMDCIPKYNIIRNELSSRCVRIFPVHYDQNFNKDHNSNIDLSFSSLHYLRLFNCILRI